MPTQADWQNMILLEVGAALDNPLRPELDVVTPNISIIWNMFADKAYYPRLQYIYAKRQALQMLLGRARMKMNTSMGGVSFQYKQIFDNLIELHKISDEELVAITKEARANRCGVAQQGGPLQPADTPLGTVPNATQAGQIFDPNAPAYRGDPLSDTYFPGGRYGV